MDYAHFIEKLQKRLQTPLPGVKAHILMAPSDRVQAEEGKMLYSPRPDSKLSAVSLMFYPQEDKIYFPLIVRPENEGVHSGQIAFPGGKKDDEDIDFIATALRETQEEVGISVQRSQVLGQLTEFYIPPSNFIVYPFATFLEHQPTFIPNSTEVARVIPVDVAHFHQDCPRVMKEISAKYMQREVPCYDIHGDIVWGATAIILSELKVLLTDIWS